MSVLWRKMMNDVDGCNSIEDVNGLLNRCGVEKGDELGMVKRSLRMYGYNRDYRERRNSSMGELKGVNSSLEKEIRELKLKLSNK